MFAASKFTHEYTKSIFKYSEPLSKDYKVYVNGKEIPVYTCRISAYPFNRVWPGFQRPVDQTETASFVNIVSDEELMIEVVPSRTYEKVMLKPYSKGIIPTETDGKISFCLKENGQFVLETDSYHHCLYLFNSAPVECPKEDEVTYYFGPGIHMPGKIALNSNESIYVHRDALVFGCIYAENAENIRVFGNGLFDDSSEERFCTHCYENFTNGNIKFYDCKNVKVEGVLFRNSAIWCVNLFHCFDVEIDGIKVFGQWRYNTDGIDVMNSQDIVVRNSFIHSFDDTVSIKGIDRYIQTDNINMLFEGCVFWCDWGHAIYTGVETACREYKNITFRDIDIIRAGNNALGVCNGDCSETHHVLFEDIRVEYNAFDTPEVYQFADDTVYDVKDQINIPLLITVHNDRFRTKECQDLWGIPMELQEYADLTGITQGGIHDITFRNIRVYYDENIPLVDGKYHVPIRISSCMEGVEFYNIRITDVTVNEIKNYEKNWME